MKTSDELPVVNAIITNPNLITPSSSSSPVKSNSSRKRTNNKSHTEDDDWILETPRKRNTKSIGNEKKLTESPNSSADIQQSSDEIVEIVEIIHTPVSHKKVVQPIKKECDKKKSNYQLNVRVLFRNFLNVKKIENNFVCI